MAAITARTNASGSTSLRTNSIMPGIKPRAKARIAAPAIIVHRPTRRTAASADPKAFRLGVDQPAGEDDETPVPGVAEVGGQGVDPRKTPMT